MSRRKAGEGHAALQLQQPSACMRGMRAFHMHGQLWHEFEERSNSGWMLPLDGPESPMATKYVHKYTPARGCTKFATRNIPSHCNALNYPSLFILACTPINPGVHMWCTSTVLNLNTGLATWRGPNHTMA